MLRSFKKRDVISIRSFSPEELLYIAATAKEIKDARKKDSLAYADLLLGRTVGVAFFEPSTRTRLSFIHAAHALGGHTVGFSSNDGTSLLKGESLRHTLEMIVGYGADYLVVRDSHDGTAQYAADFLSIPVINAGDGKHEHPTQTMLDLFTILEFFGRLDHLHIGFAGDLKYGRTVRSLQAALQAVSGTTFTYISPPQLQPPAGELQHLERLGIQYRVSDNYESVLSDLDVLYVTRIQEERFPDKQDYEKVARTLQLTPELLLKHAKPTLRVLHPLPINSHKFPEIHPCVATLTVPNTDKQYAGYIEQAANGFPVRMALLGLLAGKFGTELQEPPAQPPYQRKATLESMTVTPTLREANRVLGYIENGTVIDHLDPDALLAVVNLLGIPKDKLVIFGKNFATKRAGGRKGVLKIVDYTPTTDHLNRIAVLSPDATVNYIRNGHVVEKGRVVLPEKIEDIMECINPGCISRDSRESAAPLFYTQNRQRLFQCHYCDTLITGDNVRLR
ncbi:aspartate carbamoyltransferase [Candidatus Woesearchaeota archaeon]|nr:aspartate carbamoyltransferase [Candidatus Woesearchaeota archaeon]